MLDLLMRISFFQKQRRRLVKKRIEKLMLQTDSVTEIFRQIYRTNYWGSVESVSGKGSTLASTAAFRAEFESLLRSMRVATLFDAPCGDFNWMRRVKFPDGMQYIGADIVDELIERLNRTYIGDNSKVFMAMNIITDDHPTADLWLCRDSLFHFSFADVFKTFEHFIKSGTKYCLLTTQPHVPGNHDIKTGFHREINFLEEPFRLPEPEIVLRDSPRREAERWLGLWRNEDIAAAVRRARGPAAT
jgi:hypothetical protein